MLAQAEDLAYTSPWLLRSWPKKEALAYLQLAQNEALAYLSWPIRRPWPDQAGSTRKPWPTLSRPSQKALAFPTWPIGALA